MYELENLSEELQAELKKRMEPNFETLHFEDGTVVIPKINNYKKSKLGYDKKSGKQYLEDLFYKVGYWDYLTSEEQAYLRSNMEAKREKVLFDKSEKIKFSDWKGEQFYFGDNYYVDIGDFLELLFVDNGLDLNSYPYYVWATKERPVIGEKDAFNIFEYETADVNFEFKIEGVKELQESLDLFVEENSRIVAYWPDFSKVLLISDQVKEYLEG